MSGRNVLPRMGWDDVHATDLSGMVLWWSRVPGNRLAEVHHLKPYRGRLRVFEERGHGRLVYDEPVQISRDGRNGAEAQDIEHWQSLLRALDAEQPAGSS